MLKKTKLVIAASVAALVTACGGGGGGGTPIIYPVSQAVQYAYSHGFQQTLGVTGTAVNGSTTYPVTGSLTFNIGAATPFTFNGTVGYQSLFSISGSLSVSGQTVPLTSSSIDYFDSAYNKIGSTSNGNYCVETTSMVYPKTATVGMTGNLGTSTCYTNSSKTSVVTVDNATYTTAQGSNGNLNFKISENIYNGSNQLIGSGSTTYGVTPAGVPSLVQFVLTQTTNGVTIAITAQ